MRKSEEFVSNKKRFFDSFGPSGDEELKTLIDSEGAEVKKERAADHNLLFSGNVEDHFKIGMSISKKSLKLYTEFYSSDVIIASPLGLKSVISGEGDTKGDYDFLSSIEVLIIDNADVLMMQNWEHVQTIFENLHLQPKKSHDVDFSRVRNWILDGHSRFYRQTLIFSRIPTPPINSIFNRYCQNLAGKCQTDLMQSTKFTTGSICQIGAPLTQMFHRVDCDSPIDLPQARLDFFIEKILPQFRDEQMNQTLIFIPSYFDFVKIRNYFKKHDMSSMHCSEYNDKKSIDRARYLFYHGRVHYMLLTERFHFYNRYRIRGINNIIFYELPHYAEFYSNFCNYLPDPKREASGMINFTATVLYSKYDAQKLCAVVGKQRATHMVNSDKNVHMFMTGEK